MPKKVANSPQNHHKSLHPQSLTRQMLSDCLLRTSQKRKPPSWAYDAFAAFLVAVQIPVWPSFVQVEEHDFHLFAQTTPSALNM